MKNFLTFLIIIFISLCVGCENKKNNYLTNKIIIPDSFIQEITKYNSYQSNKLTDYYRYYLDNYSIIECLNYVNYPNFLNTNKQEAAFLNTDLLLVNKHFYLPNNFIPSSLVKVSNVKYIKRENEIMYIDKNTLLHYQHMEKVAKQNKLNIYLFSSFRSYEKQKNLWELNGFITNDYLALPGFSEHQTGLAVDIACLETGLTSHFESTEEFVFLTNNAHKFGFILRYPKNKKHITGYEYESWHYRYVGVDIATFCYENNLTLEEYIYKYTILPL